MPASQFFDEKQNLTDLLKLMPDEDREQYLRYGHNRIEGAFEDRKFIVYQPTGLTKSGAHKEPRVLDTLTITDFGVTTQNGAHVALRASDGQRMMVTHVPRKVFNYPIYISIPTNLTLRWDAREVNGRVWRSLSFAVMVKSRNRADFYSKDNTYMETPNQFRKLYPAVTGQLQF